jgi:RiboL-PSP-HEPN
MKNRELSRQQDELSRLFDKTKDFEEKGMSIDIISHWAKYLCVLCAGFLENSLAEIYIDYSSRVANPKVANFSRVSLERINNPKTEMFLRVTNYFDKAWGTSLEAYVEENGRRQAIDSIMSHRHRIAHGKDSDITIYRLSDYYKKSVEVVTYIETLCK